MRKREPAFGIYGHDVQAADDTEIPADVKEKILRYALIGFDARHRLSVHRECLHGDWGSIVNPDFFQEYLGMQ